MKLRARSAMTITAPRRMPTISRSRPRSRPISRPAPAARCWICSSVKRTLTRSFSTWDASMALTLGQCRRFTTRRVRTLGGRRPPRGGTSEGRPQVGRPAQPVEGDGDATAGGPRGCRPRRRRAPRGPRPARRRPPLPVTVRPRRPLPGRDRRVLQPGRGGGARGHLLDDESSPMLTFWWRRTTCRRRTPMVRYSRALASVSV